MENTPAWNKISEIELIYKTKTKSSDRPLITTAKDAYNLFLEIWSKNSIELIEEFKVIFLNRANKVLGSYHVSSGGITGTVADPRLIFIAALKAAACSLILCHNHPSGSLKPSRADEELTLKIKLAGQFLDIKVLDHLIICSEGFYSFAEEGII